MCRNDNVSEMIDVTNENVLRTAVLLLVEAGRSTSSLVYCRTEFDSNSLIAVKIATKNNSYRKYTHYTLYGSCPPIYGIDIIRSLSFLFPAHYHENAKICVAIKSCSTLSVQHQNNSSPALSGIYYTTMSTVYIHSV